MTKRELRALIREIVDNEIQFTDTNTADTAGMSKTKMSKQKFGQVLIDRGKQLKAGDGKGLEPAEVSLLATLFDKILAQANGGNATTLIKRLSNLIK